MNNLQLYANNSGHLTVRSAGVSGNTKTSDGTNASPFTDGKWHHIAFVYDATQTQKRKIYVDGKQWNLSNSDAAVSLGNANDYYIGRYNGNTDYNMDGEIGYLRIWDEARTAAEIRGNMFKRTPTDSNSKCKINLLFDEGTGTTVDNIGTVGSAGDATLNAALWAGAGML